MGDFRSFDSDRREGRSSGGYGGRSSGGSRGGFGGGRGGFGGGRGGFGGGRDRRDMPACDAVCAKCGKNCQVPFKPTGDKPVYCNECFASQRGDVPRSAPSFGGSSSAPVSGISADQFNQLNRKLDRVLEILESLEVLDDEDEEGEESEEEVEAEPVEKA